MVIIDVKLTTVEVDVVSTVVVKLFAFVVVVWSVDVTVETIVLVEVGVTVTKELIVVG